jgi:acyl dehydratase
MPLDYEKIMGFPPMETVQELTVRDTILYALGVGVGAGAPGDPGELKYIYEDGLHALPTMAVVMAYPGFWARDPKFGLTWQKLLHGEQSIEIHRPLPVEGRLRGVTTLDEIYDKGAGRGAVLTSSRRIYDHDGDLVATVRQASFLRADGGFGGKAEGAPKPHQLPDRAPDAIVHAATRPDQALLYRLSGDYNPLHVDPKIAAEGGFERPILHGLAGFGVVGRALLKAICGDLPERLRRMDARFSSPVYPGDVFAIDIWREGDGRAAFRARIPDRSVIALQHGYLEFGG